MFSFYEFEAGRERGQDVLHSVCVRWLLEFEQGDDGHLSMQP